MLFLTLYLLAQRNLVDIDVALLPGSARRSPLLCFPLP
jgi:hypothetical protein